jgi:hypothetical protein
MDPAEIPESELTDPGEVRSSGLMMVGEAGGDAIEDVGDKDWGDLAGGEQAVLGERLL